MSEKDKRALMILAAVLVVVFLWLVMRRGTSTVIQQEGDFSLGNVSLPGFNIGGGTGNYPPIIFPPMGRNDLHMIGACCADCSGASPARYVPASSGPTFVYNEGNKGANIFNYFTPPPPKPKVTSSMSWSGR